MIVLFDLHLQRASEERTTWRKESIVSVGSYVVFKEYIPPEIEMKPKNYKSDHPAGQSAFKKSLSRLSDQTTSRRSWCSYICAIEHKSCITGYRRVHAQRKFAQGAYVPPSSYSSSAAATAGASVSARTDASPAPPQPPPSAPHTVLNLTAHSLLDIVSLQSVHTHLPVVVIERMKHRETRLNTSHENGLIRRGGCRGAVGRGAGGGAGGAARVRRIAAARTRLLARNSSMCLRSRNHLPSLKIRPTKVMKRPKPPANITSDIEDETPLKFIKNSLDGTKSPEKESGVSGGRVTRSSANYDKDTGKPVSGAASIPKVKSKMIVRREKKKKVTPKVNSGGAVPVRTRQAPKLKEGEVSKRKTVEPEKAVATAAAEPNGELGCLSEARAGHQYYGSQGIVRWLEGGACPAAKLRTVRAATAAPAALLARVCGTCAACRRVRTVREISRLMGAPRRAAARAPPTPPDVYTFQVDGDEQPPPPLYAHRKRRDSVAPAAAPAAPADATQLLLDVDGDSPQLLQIASVPIPGTNKKMMRARIVPREETRAAPDMVLEEHEDLLDQLLHTLTQAPADGAAPAAPEDDTLVEAPVYYPTEEEFLDPIAFYEKVKIEAAPYGICKVVAPPSFRPSCILNDDIKFKVSNHYIARFYNRWGPAAMEISAMKAYLATQNVKFSRVPRLDGLEVNLPRLYRVVQRNGGLERVLEDNLWTRVADEMRLTGPNPDKMLDTYYVKYLLPYETATDEERRNIMKAVEKKWNKKYKKLLEWAANPLHHQKKLLGESESSSSETDDEPALTAALHEAEDCVVAGRAMNLSAFKKVALHAAAMYLPSADASVDDIEAEYWRLGTQANDHVAVNAASIDTAASGYGFPKHREPFSRHPWNLKMLSSSPSNVLRALGSVVGVTEPTLHLCMLFSTSCWHSDPHRLAWLEYQHEGHPKIWYGVGGGGAESFRAAVQALCPMSCQNKSTWLSSEIAMIPPQLLRARGVTLTRTVQRPGEFVLVLPDAYSCAFSTGFTVSESAYFATVDWLENITDVFEELRASCEPTTFSIEQLLLGVCRDPRAPHSALVHARRGLQRLLDRELRLRTQLADTGITVHVEGGGFGRRGGGGGSGGGGGGGGGGGAWDVREHAECGVCRATLYLSKVTGLIDKKSAVCLMHAEKLISNNPNADLAGLELRIFHSSSRLKEVMANLDKRLDIASSN